MAISGHKQLKVHRPSHFFIAFVRCLQAKFTRCTPGHYPASHQQAQYLCDFYYPFITLTKLSNHLFHLFLCLSKTWNMFVKRLSKRVHLSSSGTNIHIFDLGHLVSVRSRANFRLNRKIISKIVHFNIIGNLHTQSKDLHPAIIAGTILIDKILV